MNAEQPVLTTSQRGWIKMEFNQAVWIPCLPAFPEGENRDSWARIYAEHLWEASGMARNRRQVDFLRKTLIAVHKQIYSTLPCQMALLHMPALSIPALPVCFGIWQAEGDRTTQLRALAHADETENLIRPPLVEECYTDKLGSGLKTICYLSRPRETTVTASLNYAWRSEELQTAVRMFTMCGDLGRLHATMPDIDELIQVIDFIPISPPRVAP
jgi:hypothetical protein